MARPTRVFGVAAISTLVGFVACISEDPGVADSPSGDAGNSGDGGGDGGSSSGADGAGASDAGSSSGSDGASDAGPAKRVFVTSEKFQVVELKALGGADAHCSAAAAKLAPGSWKAWLSSVNAKIDAKDRVGSGPWKRLDSARVANTIAELTSGSLQNPIAFTEDGLTLGQGEHVWTGTKADGTQDPSECNGWVGGGISGRTGNPTKKDMAWTAVTTLGDCSTGDHHLYCFEE